jgi:KUP system potassium uptake protein
MTMYVWFYARKINNRFTKFIDLGKFVKQINELSEDNQIPKFSTHLVYMTKANSRHQIEEKIVKSIFAKKPKRADVYWFLHIDRTEEPYTLSYSVNELVDDKVIKINMKIGFRIQPKTEYYFKKIVQELVKNKELVFVCRKRIYTKRRNAFEFLFLVEKIGSAG